MSMMFLAVGSSPSGEIWSLQNLDALGFLPPNRGLFPHLFTIFGMDDKTFRDSRGAAQVLLRNFSFQSHIIKPSISLLHQTHDFSNVL